MCVDGITIETTHTAARAGESHYGKSLSLRGALRFSDAISSLCVTGCSFYGRTVSSRETAGASDVTRDVMFPFIVAAVKPRC